MPADVAPLVADGGNIRLVRRVAAYAYGSREVTWPEGAEDPKDELPDGREFGWVAQLAGPRPGLSGRRFVRADAVIDAVEGVSNTEQLLDDAAERTGGDVHFETLITGRGLAGQVPGVDFALGDRVPARFWGRVLPGQLVTEVGWEEDGPYAKLGGQMLRDLDALARTRAELTRTIRKEREETAGAVESVRSYADSAVSRERTERQEDVAQVREVLGGAQADERVLVSQLSAVQAQIAGMVGDGETPPPAGLLNAYLWMNTRLWEQQREVNRQNEEFKRITAALDAQQSEQIQQLTEIQKRLVDESSGRIRELMATPGGTSDPTVPVTLLSDGSWRFVISDAVEGSILHAKWYTGTPTRLQLYFEDIRVIDTQTLRFTVPSDRPYIYMRWAAATRKQVTVNTTGGGWDVARSSWQQILTHPAPAKKPTNVVLRLKVTWDSATYDDTYKIRVRAGDRTLREYTTTHLGPLTFLGDGERWMSVMVSGVELEPGEQIFVDVYSTATFAPGRRVKRAELTGTWIEDV